MGIAKDIKVLVFKAAEQFFSLETGKVRKIVHLPELSIPPGLPSFIEGFLQVPGNVIPVVSLPQLFFSSPAAKHPYTPLILLGTPGAETPPALLADAIIEIAVLPGEKRLPVQEENVFNHCVSAFFEMKSQKVYLLDPARILPEQAKERLKEFRGIARERPAAPRAAVPSENVPVLLFSLGKETFAVELNCLQEILTFEKRKCTPVPGTPGAVEGIINLGGSLRCVLNLSRLIRPKPRDEAGTHPDSGYILIVKENQVGLKIDTINEIFSLAKKELEEIQRQEYDFPTRYFKGGIVQKRNTRLLDIDKILLHPIFGGAER